jgi:integrase
MRGGGYLNQSNVLNRVLKPAAIAAGVWLSLDTKGRTTSGVGFHTFRHTCATMLFRHGLNAKQVQMWLGHHSPAFTLETYVHLLPDDLPEPDFLDGLTDSKRRKRQWGGPRCVEQATVVAKPS